MARRMRRCAPGCSIEEWRRPQTSTQRLYAAAAKRFADHFGPTPLGEVERLCATQLLELGLSHFDVSVQLGHTDGGALVMARYGRPSVDAAK